MKILFISHYCLPHIGGVEKHIEKVSEILKKRGHSVTVIAKDHPIKYPNTKILGLLVIWKELFKLRIVIQKADIVHIHDVFIWYLPFRFLYPRKKVYTTFHGGQDVWPVPLKHKILYKLTERLSVGSIAVGGFIEKYYNIKPNYVIYGGVEKIKKQKFKKERNSIIWLGRLDKNTGILEFLSWLKNNKRKLKVIFLGDGELRDECVKFGKVKGFVSNPLPYLIKAETIAPVGYLSYLEAKQVGAKIKTFATTPIKKDYWKGISKLKDIPTWKDVVSVYLKLWKT